MLQWQPIRGVGGEGRGGGRGGGGGAAGMAAHPAGWGVEEAAAAAAGMAADPGVKEMRGRRCGSTWIRVHAETKQVQVLLVKRSHCIHTLHPTCAVLRVV